MIAEDELLERKMMCKFIDENFSDMEVIGEAPNGRVAIELANQLQPNIMLMDIKMPGVSGIEAIEQIIEQHPSMKFIIVSAYDSFDYAKQAMQFGVKEYILKPSKKEEMIRAILRVRNEVEQEQETLNHKAHSIEIARELFLSKVMKQEIQEETIELQQELFPQFQSGFFWTIEGVATENVPRLKQFLRSRTDDDVLIHHDDHRCSVLFISHQQQTKAFLLQLARKVQLELGEDVYIGIGYPARKLAQLPRSYQQAFKAVHILMERKQTNYGFPEEKRTTEQDQYTRLITAIETGNEQEAVTFFTQIYETIEGPLDQLAEVFYTIKQMHADKVDMLNTMSFYQLQTRQDWYDFIKVICLQIQQYYQSQNKIERAKTYIEHHYDQPLSLDQISQYIDLSTNYFSNLFKEATGEAFIDYLTRLRLNKAKQYLKENHYSLKQISAMVGYKDPNYFSRVFKKHVNMSPKQYQNKIIKK
ncbi:response regulator [Aquibacillus sediminis]|uniref:response regulator n=1 Tax=Aquibacillus sediminis TaxID=2574734 RepID=UPI001FE64194|nr:response regulator [Aquibacillus sediminis]